ncbi:MAG TPA: HPP family protein [Candidatus Angelobacter sp.]|nr:HPP family protein [Candidatus Angelobacter sp.]
MHDNLKPSKPWHLRVLKRRHHRAAMIAVYGFLSGSLAIAVLAVMAHLAHSPLVFPSLGPTAFLLFYEPLTPQASPKNTILGHLIGAGAGWLCLLAFGLANEPGAGLGIITWPRMGAAALSIGITIGLMEYWDVPHAPAGATTMIVSLGLMSQLWQLGILMGAVVALVALGWAINHFVGIHYPVWSPVRHSSGMESSG